MARALQLRPDALPLLAQPKPRPKRTLRFCARSSAARRHCPAHPTAALHHHQLSSASAPSRELPHRSCDGRAPEPRCRHRGGHGCHAARRRGLGLSLRPRGAALPLPEEPAAADRHGARAGAAAQSPRRGHERREAGDGARRRQVPAAERAAAGGGEDADVGRGGLRPHPPRQLDAPARRQPRLLGPGDGARPVPARGRGHHPGERCDSAGMPSSAASISLIPHRFS